jgi:hypothetical protein
MIKYPKHKGVNLEYQIIGLIAASVATVSFFMVALTKEKK